MNNKLVGLTSLVLPHPVNIKAISGDGNKVLKLYSQIGRKTSTKYGTNQTTITNNLVAAYNHLLAHDNDMIIEDLIRSADSNCLVDAILAGKFGQDVTKQLIIAMELFDHSLENSKIIQLVNFLLDLCSKNSEIAENLDAPKRILRSVLRCDTFTRAYPTVKTRKALVKHPVIQPVFDRLNANYKTLYVTNPKVDEYYKRPGGSRLPMDIEHALYHTTQQASKWQNMNL